MSSFVLAYEPLASFWPSTTMTFIKRPASDVVNEMPVDLLTNSDKLEQLISDFPEVPELSSYI